MRELAFFYGTINSDRPAPVFLYHIQAAFHARHMQAIEECAVTSEQRG